MTALRFQTGGRHQTSPASLQGDQSIISVRAVTRQEWFTKPLQTIRGWIKMYVFTSLCAVTEPRTGCSTGIYSHTFILAQQSSVSQSVSLPTAALLPYYDLFQWMALKIKNHSVCLPVCLSLLLFCLTLSTYCHSSALSVYFTLPPAAVCLCLPTATLVLCQSISLCLCCCLSLSTYCHSSALSVYFALPPAAVCLCLPTATLVLCQSISFCPLLLSVSVYLLPLQCSVSLFCSALCCCLSLSLFPSLPVLGPP